MSLRSLLALPVLFAVSTTVHADVARQRLNAFATGIRSATATFTQQVADTNGKAGKPTEGTLALEAPRQFRWDVTKPYQQLIVADGMHVWIYDPDLEQVTVRNQGIEEAHSPLTVLTDLGQLDHEFTAKEQGERDGLVWLRLTSKSKEPEFDYADLGFDTNGLARMTFKDMLGNTTEIRFANWQRNPSLSPNRFTFVPPPGVDVVGDVTPEAETRSVRD